MSFSSRLLLLLALLSACVTPTPTLRSRARGRASTRDAVAPLAAAPLVSVTAPGALAEVTVPAHVARALLPRHKVAGNLRNPRGLVRLPDGALLVAEAGTGAPDDLLSGGIVKLALGADGRFGERRLAQVLLAGQPSKNILEIVRRDEVFGMGGMATGQGRVFASLAFFGGPSTVFALDGLDIETWTTTSMNINDLTYDAGRKRWFAVASTTDEIVELKQGRGSERVVKLLPLASGQDAVPAYLEHDPRTGELLVSLFSGSPEGEEGGQGVELVPRAGGIVAVDPDQKSVRWVVRGLSVPTDLQITSEGNLCVLEFCDAFLDPAASFEQLFAAPSHGGFRRFSGRLLFIDRVAKTTTVVADGLDAPTNLLLADGALYVAQGMGTPGRPIPIASASAGRSAPSGARAKSRSAPSGARAKSRSAPSGARAKSGAASVLARLSGSCVSRPDTVKNSAISITGVDTRCGRSPSCQ